MTSDTTTAAPEDPLTVRSRISRVTPSAARASPRTRGGWARTASPSSPPTPRVASATDIDSDFLFRHDSYFYYLTRDFTEPNAWLRVLKSPLGRRPGRSTLFCAPAKPL
jgi:hypothetical protein